MCAPSSRTSFDASRPFATSDSSKLTTRNARPSSLDATTAPAAFSCWRSLSERSRSGPPFSAVRLDEEHVALAADDLEVGRRLPARLLRLLAHLLELVAQRVRLARLLAEVRERLAGGDRLDAARACADRALAEDRERPDLRGRADVRAAAQLDRPAADVDDAHDLAVLLAEEHHRAELARLGDRRLVDAHGQVLEDALVDAALDLGALLGGERLRMGEVEAELVGPHGGARLLDVVAEHLAQALVQQVRAGVVRLRREAHVPRRRPP